MFFISLKLEQKITDILSNTPYFVAKTKRNEYQLGDEFFPLGDKNIMLFQKNSGFFLVYRNNKSLIEEKLLTFSNQKENSSDEEIVIALCEELSLLYQENNELPDFLKNNYTAKEPSTNPQIKKWLDYIKGKNNFYIESTSPLKGSNNTNSSERLPEAYNKYLAPQNLKEKALDLKNQDDIFVDGKSIWVKINNKSGPNQLAFHLSFEDDDTLFPTPKVLEVHPAFAMSEVIKAKYNHFVKLLESIPYYRNISENTVNSYLSILDKNLIYPFILTFSEKEQTLKLHIRDQLIFSDDPSMHQYETKEINFKLSGIPENMGEIINIMRELIQDANRTFSLEPPISIEGHSCIQVELSNQISQSLKQNNEIINSYISFININSTHDKFSGYIASSLFNIPNQTQYFASCHRPVKNESFIFMNDDYMFVKINDSTEKNCLFLLDRKKFEEIYQKNKNNTIFNDEDKTNICWQLSSSILDVFHEIHYVHVMDALLNNKLNKLEHLKLQKPVAITNNETYCPPRLVNS